MARFELKRNGWLIGISALMISTAVWADDATTVPDVPDDGGLVAISDGGVQFWHDINPGAGDEGSDLTATDDGSDGGTDVTVVDDGTDVTAIDDGTDVTAVDDGTDTTVTDDGSGDETVVDDGTDTTVTDDGSGDETVVDDGTDTTVVDDGSGDETVVDDGTDTTVVDDGAGDGTSVDDGTDVPVAYDDNAGGVFTMISGTCMGCDAVTNDVVSIEAVAAPRAVSQATASQVQVVAHESAEPSGGRCDAAAIAWLCEWKTGKSN